MTNEGSARIENQNVGISRAPTKLEGERENVHSCPTVGK